MPWLTSKRAGAYAAQGKLDRALSDLGEALRLNDRLAPAYYERANCYTDQGRSHHWERQCSQGLLRQGHG